VLVEIGPRFVLNPIKILNGSFFGTPLYENPNFVSPNLIRAMQRKRRSRDYLDRKISTQKREERKPERRLDPDELDFIFADEDDSENSEILANPDNLEEKSEKS